MLRVVLDTNVYISALNFGGLPLEVLVLGVKKEVAIFISPSIFKEIEGVLIRKFRWPAERIAETLATVQGFTETVHPKKSVSLIKNDESDNRILECAQESRADLIVTGDDHLLKLKSFQGIPILRPREFMESRVWSQE